MVLSMRPSVVYVYILVSVAFGNRFGRLNQILIHIKRESVHWVKLLKVVLLPPLL